MATPSGDRPGSNLVEVVARWKGKEHGHPAICSGVGIHYSDLLCGIIGEDMRLEFMVLGDTVNIATLLEQATKTHGVPILVSETAYRAAGPGPGDWREVNRVPLRGRAEAKAYVTPAEPNEPVDLGIPMPRLTEARA